MPVTSAHMQLSIAVLLLVLVFPVLHFTWCPLLLQIPYFNAPIFLENKTQIGKVEEILGSINNVVSKRPRYQPDCSQQLASLLITSSSINS